MQRLMLFWILALGLLPVLTACASDYQIYDEAAASEHMGTSPDPAAGAEPEAMAEAPSEAPAEGAAAEAAAPEGVAVEPAAAVEPLAAVDAQPAGAAAGAELQAPTESPTARLDAAGGPARLEIPAIGVDAYIEHVGLTADQAMDVPSEWGHVGWFDEGFRPGEPGNAVMAGHLDSAAGGPAVFWDLDKVAVGDQVIVTYENGDRYTFVVEDWRLYDHDAQGSIIDSIFGRSQTADLNLVTCDGAWDHGAATYTKRFVLFTTLVPELTVLGPGAKIVD